MTTVLIPKDPNTVAPNIHKVIASTYYGIFDEEGRWQAVKKLKSATPTQILSILDDLLDDVYGSGASVMRNETTFQFLLF